LQETAQFSVRIPQGWATSFLPSLHRRDARQWNYGSLAPSI